MRTLADIDWDSLDNNPPPKRRRTMQLLLTTNKHQTVIIEHWPSLYPNSQSGDIVFKYKYTVLENEENILNN